MHPHLVPDELQDLTELIHSSRLRQVRTVFPSGCRRSRRLLCVAHMYPCLMQSLQVSECVIRVQTEAVITLGGIHIPVICCLRFCSSVPVEFASAQI